ncbi:hypothetical protein R50073_41130 [Maricurvus nonylphenolicus]
MKLLAWPLLIVLLSPLVSAEPLSVRYVQGGSIEPFSYRVNGVAKGVLPDIVSLVFSSLGVEAHTRLIPESRTLFEIINNRADATAVLVLRNITIEDYPEILTVCPNPLFVSKVYLIWHSDTQLIPGKIYDLDKYRVGIWNSGRGFLQKAGVPTAERLKFQDAENMFKSVVSRRIDAAIMSWDHVEFLSKRLGVEGQVQKGQFVSDLYLHLAVTDSWLAEGGLVGQVCEKVSELKQAGEFHTIIDHYLGQK